jgi:putative component of toxin-antitoxin plasmid stabilization module
LGNAASIGARLPYLAKDRNALIVLFGGGTKRGQTGDIRRAERSFAEYKRRKAAAAKSRG